MVQIELHNVCQAEAVQPYLSFVIVGPQSSFDQTEDRLTLIWILCLFNNWCKHIIYFISREKIIGQRKNAISLLSPA